LLRDQSRQTNLKLADVAAAVVDGHPLLAEASAVLTGAAQTEQTSYAANYRVRVRGRARVLCG
jgi:hypothetical protein